MFNAFEKSFYFKLEIVRIELYLKAFRIETSDQRNLTFVLTTRSNWKRKKNTIFISPSLFMNNWYCVTTSKRIALERPTKCANKKKKTEENRRILQIRTLFVSTRNEIPSRQRSRDGFHSTDRQTENEKRVSIERWPDGC